MISDLLVFDKNEVILRVKLFWYKSEDVSWWHHLNCCPDKHSAAQLLRGVPGGFSIKNIWRCSYGKGIFRLNVCEESLWGLLKGALSGQGHPFWSEQLALWRPLSHQLLLGSAVRGLQQPLRGGHLAHQLWCHGPLAMCSSKKGFSFLRWQLQVSSPLSCLSREPAL